jgi:two-component system sensor histidine kinase PilS (NtrC family)
MFNPKELLANRIKKVSFFRVVIALLSLFLVIYWKTKIEIFSEKAIFYEILIFIFFISVVYGILIKYSKRLEYLAVVQIIFDLLVIGFLIAFTGGIDSPFIFFYALPILEAGIFFGKNSAYTTMFVCLIELAAGFVFQYYRIYPYKEAQYLRGIAYAPDEFYYSFSVFALGFLILGLLIGYLNLETSKIREHLEESEAKFYDLESLKGAIIKSINSGLVVFTNNSDVTYMNEIAIDTMKKINFIEKEKTLIHLFNEELQQVVQNQKVYRSEKKVTCYNGENMWLGYSLVPLMDHNDAVIGTLLNYQDITSLKVMEENLRISDKFAFLGKLSAVIAHEIKNPLASLKGGVGLLKETLDLDDENKKVLDIIQREIERLKKVIDDFLSYTKSPNVNMSKIYLKNLLEEIWFELMFSAVNKDNYSFIYKGDENVIIHGDPNQIRQVFLNLFINSIEIMKENNDGGKVAVQVESSKDSITVDVEDEGGGINDANIDRIFDPFFSLKNNGTGLGLAIVYKIMQEHGGMVGVRNAGKGAVFSLRFKA